MRSTAATSMILVISMIGASAAMPAGAADVVCSGHQLMRIRSGSLVQITISPATKPASRERVSREMRPHRENMRPR